MTQTVAELLRDAASRLASAESANARGEADQLMQSVLGLSTREWILFDRTQTLDDDARARFSSLVLAREGRRPLQYLLGTVPFCEIDLVVGDGALIPRPETEVLVERMTPRLSATSPGWILDVGTGTGAILLALLHRLPAFRGIGVDLFPEPLGFARRNAAALQSGRPDEGATRVSWLRANLLDPFPAAPVGSLRAIVSNPPYIPTGELESLESEVREYEPRSALDGGEDGLDLARILVRRASELLPPEGLLALELAEGQSERLWSEVQSEESFELLELYDDLAGRDRGLILERRGS